MNPGLDVNWTNRGDLHRTVLHAASIHGTVEAVKLLLAHPDIKVNEKDFGSTPLSFGCQEGHEFVVELLLKDSRVNVTLDDHDGCTPLWWASLRGHHEVVEWLVASDRDLGDIENKKGKYWENEG